MTKKKATDEPQIVSLDTKQDESFISTGISEIDQLVGGFARGRITELWGAEGVGKTHTVSKVMAHTSKDHKVLYIDTEFALNKERVAQLGADTSNIDFIADARLERVCELLIANVGKYDLIILDSLAYLTPLTVDNAEVGENAIGLFSRLIKHWVVKFRPRLGTSKTAFVVINQYRKPIGLYVKAEPPGGTSWNHAVDVRLYLHRNASDKVIKNSQVVGHNVHVDVVKSKVSQPFKTTKYFVEY